MQTAAVEQFDVVVSGGGMAGMAFAIGLARVTRWRIALLEQASPQQRAGDAFDARAIALIPSSIQLFQDLDLWPQLSAATAAIERIHVSEQGRFGKVDLKAAEFGWEYFGRVIPAAILGKILFDVMHASANIKVISPAQLHQFAVDADEVRLEYLQDNVTHKATAKLLVAADGASSFIRDKLQIKCNEQDYGQTALLANVLPDRPHQHCAYERFTANGPLALLPISDNRMTLIWCDATATTLERAKLSDAELLAAFQQSFGLRAGRFVQIGKRSVFPLKQFVATEQYRDRVVLLGNTAHTLHPVAAQGLNLSLRDIAVLLSQLATCWQNAGDPGARQLLQNYAAQRQRDQKMVHKFTECLLFAFGNDDPVLGPVLGKLRSVAMSTFNCMPNAKRLFARAAMGLNSSSPRLACLENIKCKTA